MWNIELISINIPLAKVPSPQGSTRLFGMTTTMIRRCIHYIFFLSCISRFSRAGGCNGWSTLTLNPLDPPKQTFAILRVGINTSHFRGDRLIHRLTDVSHLSPGVEVGPEMSPLQLLLLATVAGPTLISFDLYSLYA